MPVPTKEKTGNNQSMPPDINSSGASMESQSAVCGGDSVDENADESAVPAKDEDKLPLAPRPALVHGSSEEKFAEVANPSLPDVRRHRWDEVNPGLLSNTNAGNAGNGAQLPIHSSNRNAHDRPGLPPSSPPEASSFFRRPVRRDNFTRDGYRSHRTMVVCVPDFNSDYRTRDASVARQPNQRSGIRRRDPAYPGPQSYAAAARPRYYANNNPDANQRPLDVGESLGYVRPRGYIQSPIEPARRYRGTETDLYHTYPNHPRDFTHTPSHFVEFEPPPTQSPQDIRLPYVTVTDTDAIARRNRYLNGTRAIYPAARRVNQFMRGTSPPNLQDFSGTYLTLPGTRRPRRK